MDSSNEKPRSSLPTDLNFLESEFPVNAPITTNKSAIVNKLTHQIFGIDWNDYFPARFQNLEVQTTSAELGFQFLESRAKDIETQCVGTGFYDDFFPEQKRNYYNVAGDFFFFMKDGSPVGIFVGTPFDWSSYYFRFVWIDPIHRGGGDYSELLSLLCEKLKLRNVARVFADVSPYHRQQSRMLHRLKFVVTGMNLSERWGHLLQFTRILSETVELDFRKKTTRFEFDPFK
jgi:Acetyltransferase (GNAT) family